jgi:hypothetical protein
MMNSLAFGCALAGLTLFPAIAWGQDVGTPYRTRAFFHARLEPEKTVLEGAGQDPVGFKDYCDALGPAGAPVLFMTYVPLTGRVEDIERWGREVTGELSSARLGNLIPQIGLGMTQGKDAGNGADTLVASGAFDAQIDAFCRVLKSLDRRVFVRIGFEFEGKWNGYHPQAYQAAFIRITQALRKSQIDAATVWCSAGVSAGGQSLDRLMTFYPGDAWVDWWGIDLFAATELLSDRTLKFCDGARAHQKPVMIGESSPRRIGTRGGQDSWDRWFSPYFKLIHERPEIKAFCYINWEWGAWAQRLGFKWTDWGDCRIEQSEVVAGLFRREMELRLYQHGVCVGSTTSP